MFAWLLSKALNKAMSFRSDGMPQLTYFSGDDYRVESTPFSFQSKGLNLYGRRYFMGKGPYKGVLVFFHGFGAGHTAYVQEICHFAKKGYLVYAYDASGSMMSEGFSAGRFSRGFLDQKAFFAFLDKEEMAQGLPRFAAGHSMGGYIAFGAMKPEYNVTKIISISGPISLQKVLEKQEKSLAKFPSIVGKALRIMGKEDEAVEPLEILRLYKGKLLYVQGELDQVVPKEENYDVLLRLFSEDPKVRLILVQKAFHNPYWSRDAEAYSKEIAISHHMFSPRFDNSFSIDYARLMENDTSLLQRFDEFLETE